MGCGCGGNSSKVKASYTGHYYSSDQKKKSKKPIFVRPQNNRLKEQEYQSENNEE
jgi:hypothetical protein